MATIESAGYRKASRESAKALSDASRQIYREAYGPAGDEIYNEIVLRIRGQMVFDD